MSTTIKVTQPLPSTTLTSLHELSITYRILRTVIKPLRPRLVKPGKPLPAGSPKLTNHPSSKNKCRIVERKDNATGLWLYDFIPDTKTASKKVNKYGVLYFAGGGFQSAPASEHWAFVSKLASNEKLASCDFTLVSYPLAPNSPACESLPILRKFLQSACTSASEAGHKLILMGDSAGGNIALSLGLWWIDQLSIPKPQQYAELEGSAGTSEPGAIDTTTDISNLHNTLSYGPSSNVSIDLHSVLTAILAISPAADLRNTNPAIAKVNKHDPILTSSLIEQTAAAWTSSAPTATISQKQQTSNKDKLEDLTSRTNPYISPILVSSETLEKSKSLGLKIHGVIGTHDVLGADAELFRQRLFDADVAGDWLVWHEQMHCFVLAGVYGMKEGKKGISWVVDTLSKSLSS